MVLDKDIGGLGLGDFKIKMNILCVKPFFSSLQIDGEIPLCLTLARNFMANHLFQLFPHLWSNVESNLDFCPKPFLTAFCIVKDLANINFTLIVSYQQKISLTVYIKLMFLFPSSDTAHYLSTGPSMACSLQFQLIK